MARLPPAVTTTAGLLAVFLFGPALFVVLLAIGLNFVLLSASGES